MRQGPQTIRSRGRRFANYGSHTASTSIIKSSRITTIFDSGFRFTLSNRSRVPPLQPQLLCPTFPFFFPGWLHGSTVGHHFFETMCPTAFLAPTLIAKTCFICTQPKHAFFLAQLALQGHRANGKKPLAGRVPGPKKGTKMVPKSGSFQKEFFCSVATKKSQKLDRALP